jgi:hypothetical protein
MGIHIVYRMVKWVMVSTLALGSMAQAQSSDTGGYPQVRELAGKENQKVGSNDFNHIYAVVNEGERKSLAVSHLPAKLAPPQPRSNPPVPPSKPNLPPPPPPRETPPPPIGNAPPPVPPPVTHTPPPVPPPVTRWPPPPTAAPEIDAHFGLSGLALLVGGLLVMRGGRSRRFAG